MYSSNDYSYFPRPCLSLSLIHYSIYRIFYVILLYFKSYDALGHKFVHEYEKVTQFTLSHDEC